MRGPRCLSARLITDTHFTQVRIMLIPWPSDLMNTSKNKQVTMTSLLQRVYISKINLSIQPLYFVLLTYTLPSPQLRVLCYFKAMSASCVSRPAISLPSDTGWNLGKQRRLVLPPLLPTWRSFWVSPETSRAAVWVSPFTF